MKNKELPSIDDLVQRDYGLADMRAADEGSSIEGHAAVYNQRTNIGGWFYEVIERGAFDDADFKDVLFCANHNLRQIPLARSRNNNSNSTLQLNIVEKGLHVRAELDIENNSEARSLYSAVKREDIKGMSFIFYIAEERWVDLDKEMPTRYISKIKCVREVSAVNFPAYEGTDIATGDARDKEALESARSKEALDSARAKSRTELDSSEQRQLELMKLKNQNLSMKG